MKIYECERCKEEFKIPEYELPDRVILSYGIKKELYKEEDNEPKDVCSNCMAVISYMWTHVEKFDKLTEEISLEETGE